MSKKLFITGTGTDVGKTYVTGLILKKLREMGKSAAYYKAAMSGNDRTKEGNLIPGDAVFVKNMSGISQPEGEMCPYVYENAYSPHLASRIEGNPVKMDVVRAGFEKVCQAYDYVTMEGSGGILCPICFDGAKIQLEDVIRELGLSSIIIADAGLGAINSVVLTAEYMRQKNLPLKGIIFNRFHRGNVMEEDNLAMCQHMTGLQVLACVEDGAKDLDIGSEALLSLYED
ncbi:MAG: dethiobiotin synthase [Roseburia sp.]|nr:dethiobiotin synthase [Roseburia sp.]